MIATAKVDAKGRLYIPKELRDEIGKEVFLIRTPNGILIVPKPEDPISELEKLGKKLPDKPIEELKQDILKEAERELR